MVLLLGGSALEPSQWLWSWFEGHLNASGFGLEAILMPLGPSQWLWAHFSRFGAISVALGLAWRPPQWLWGHLNGFEIDFGATSMTLGSAQWHRGRFGGHFNAFGSILMTLGPSGCPSVALGLVWGPSQCLWIHLSGFGVDLGAI